MNLALWIIAIVLAVAFAGSGVMKLAVPKDKLVTAGQGWAQDVSPTNIRLIGRVELLGAVGLVLPAAVHIAPILVPLAAVGLALVMVGAIVVHARRKEPMNIVVNVVLISLAVFVALGRFGPYPFSS
ncbi:DoxX family protein [Mycolicibacterium moriokaense]|uniref:DoxX-like protein n=1 Tax=Mycolicibacterium moriokaense TaxID=39691 RepID=A0A318HH54_9MYCO|nr:DoxX family protein [Mycolicibacterium moriokaense]PXX03366.1 DoxX-like protein [Mycolicibacterium moriokaense]